MKKQQYNPYDGSLDFSKSVTDEVLSVCPVNPLTGLCDSVITRFESSLSDAERSAVSRYIQANPSVSGFDLSDDDLLSILPSRRISSLSELSNLRSYYINMAQQAENSARQASQQTAQQTVKPDVPLKKND